jgi:hypothetical protein
MYYPTMYSGIANLSAQVASKLNKIKSEIFKGKHQLSKPETSSLWCLHRLYI